MKKILIIVIALCLAFGLVACAKPAEQQLAEQLANEIAESIVAEDVIIDSDDDGTITINDGEDQLVIEGSEVGMPWPGDKLPGNVPELNGAKVVSVASTDEGILIGFEECDKDEAIAYKEQIKGAGWNVLMDASDDEGGMLMSNNDAGESLMFVWDTEEQGGAITYSAAQ